MRSIVWPRLLVALVCAFLFLRDSRGQNPTPTEFDKKLAELKDSYDRKFAELKSSYEARITTLEGEVGGLRSKLDRVEEEKDLAGLDSQLESAVQDVIERQGIAASGQTTIWDNTFNPAISLIGDTVLAISNRRDGAEDYNRFILRDVELGIHGRVDPLMAYHFFVHFGEDEIEVEEAYGWADQWLPDTLTLKFGRFNSDFGKFSPVHAHDLPFVDHPGVLQEYLGGSLRGTGLELHHWMPVGETHVLRWSFGILNELDGDDHPVVGPLVGEHGHHEEEHAASGRRSLENFGFTARVSALLETGQDSTLQVGSSLAWAPEVQEHFENMTGPMPFDDMADLNKLVFGMDATFRWLDEATGEGLTVGAEFLLNRQEFLDEAAASTFTESALGFYAWLGYDFDPDWSVGASFDWFERAEDSNSEWWDVGAWVTWNVNHFNRLRMEFRFVEDQLMREDYWVLMFQWVTILGSHGHGVEW